MINWKNRYDRIFKPGDRVKVVKTKGISSSFNSTVYKKGQIYILDKNYSNKEYTERHQPYFTLGESWWSTKESNNGMEESTFVKV